ncbi:MAG TPA: gliding motility lipoprotein GldD [Bacteroidales bacterium]|nr:gliding motility lipoprotein GldD [Bacteroidales bacterium]HPB25084.1 gliding motility lipoprotein GldD [Bacteroidales bacterium]HQN16093.1 gliding motility lipoprotein GldD [Bacteroidales bacterium]HQP14755.1 gliding motility lipoprotein GldD [Bacteroidales bacterium]
MKKARKNKPLLAIVLLFALMFLYACNNDDYVPKPRGYFRIALPEKKYKLFDSIYPYSFEYPDYSLVRPDMDKRAEPYWMNLEFPSFKGTLHISYKKVTSDSILYQYFEDARTFANKHIAKAEDIEPKIIRDDQHQVYGMIYDISGSGVASTYQFCVTDSTTHFLRGALYFNVMPNNDSLSPVIDFIKFDIDHLIQTLRWTKKD